MLFFSVSATPRCPSVERIPLFTVLLIFFVTLATGPFGVVDATRSPTGVQQANGSVTVSSVAFPADIAIERGSGVNNEVVLTVPPATVNYASVRGAAYVKYRVSVSELGRQATSLHRVSPGTNNEQALTIEPLTFIREDTLADSYGATLTVLVQDGDGQRVVASQSVRIPVRG